MATKGSRFTGLSFTDVDVDVDVERKQAQAIASVCIRSIYYIWYAFTFFQGNATTNYGYLPDNLPNWASPGNWLDPEVTQT